MRLYHQCFLNEKLNFEPQEPTLIYIIMSISTSERALCIHQSELCPIHLWICSTYHDIWHFREVDQGYIQLILIKLAIF